MSRDVLAISRLFSVVYISGEILFSKRERIVDQSRDQSIVKGVVVTGIKRLFWWLSSS